MGNTIGPDMGYTIFGFGTRRDRPGGDSFAIFDTVANRAPDFWLPAWRIGLCWEAT
jgi:hypothetical protein